MERRSGPRDTIVRATIGKHLALSPIAFAVTEGPAHALMFANAVFRRLLSGGKISIGASQTPPVDLKPLLDRVFRSGETERDVVLDPDEKVPPSWSCTVWPVPGSHDVPGKLVIEVRDIALIEGAKARQRAVAERLLLGALREQDVAREATGLSDRAQYLAKVSRDLSISLDESATRDAVRRLTLPREGSWCIVDVVESNGAIHRLAVVHPDPEKEALARTLEGQWPAPAQQPAGVTSMLRAARPTIVTDESGAALMLAAHGKENLRILRQIGFGSLLVVPLVVRAQVRGAITFVSRAGDPPFTPLETALAVDVAARCAMALDNARLYREADALRLVAELANKSKSEFLGSMSHELRTPLNAIGGFAELIDLGIQGPVTDKQRDSLARIRSNQEHLLTLITEILNFVRVESGRMEYRNTQVPLNKALSDVAGMLSVAVAEKGLAIQGPSEDVDPMAWADPDRVRQILVNLVMNSVKYMQRNGGTITLTSEIAGDTVAAHVTDMGPGIPSENMESIFEPFVQLTSGLADRRGGVGLGLAISRDLARAMDGDLTVESSVGVGSRFTLILPLARSGSKSAPSNLKT
jgi:signal transduction histidine kinase